MLITIPDEEGIIIFLYKLNRMRRLRNVIYLVRQLLSSNMVSGDPSHPSDALVAVVRRKVETRLF